MKNNSRASLPQSQRAAVIRLTTDAMLAAVYIVLASFLSLNLPFTQISLSSFPILLCAFLFGTGDAVAVALCGSFVEQVLYGLSPTAPLWMLPPILMALAAGLPAWLFRRLSGREMKLWQVITVAVVGEVFLTVANTAVLYLDARIVGYPVKALAVLLPTRLLNCGLRAVCTTALTVLLLPLMRNLTGKLGLGRAAAAPEDLSAEASATEEPPTDGRP